MIAIGYEQQQINASKFRSSKKRKMRRKRKRASKKPKIRPRRITKKYGGTQK